ncbi:MAG TPA: hypothetical protein VFR87_13140 [Nocardioidaceae bacterium]|nr:hypothetical protein [Nocardioidaceae bacterium]
MRRGRAMPSRLLGWLCLAVVLVRGTYVLEPLRSDEAGYLYIARQAHLGGEFMYGDYYVDRPPLLMVIFKVAALTDWDPMIRLLTIPFAVVFVLAAARAAFHVGGEVGARWGPAVAAAFICTPAMAADQADGALFAAVFVMVGLALALSAWRATTSGGRLGLAYAAGAFAGAAPLLKQNFLDALLFIAVLVVARAVRDRRLDERGLTVSLAGAAGALTPHVLLWLWALAAGIEPLSLWRDLALFRGEAFGVILSDSLEAPLRRAAALVVLGLVSGVLLVVVLWFRQVGPRVVAWTPLEWAISATTAFGMTAIVAGGSYWPHYLLQLAPVGVLALAVVVGGRLGDPRPMQGAARIAVGSAIVGAVLVAVVYATTPWVWFHQRTGEWLAASGQVGDTAVVLYGNAAVLEAADMRSPYPHLWSLPMRTLDPDQSRLRATLSGPSSPLWVVELVPVNSWNIDEAGSLRDLLDRRYRVVGEVCGFPVWLRDDVDRRPAPQPDC